MLELENINRQYYELVRQLINNTDSKLFVEITKQEKAINTINSKISNTIDIDTRLSLVDLIIPLFCGEKCEEHTMKFSNAHKKFCRTKE